MAQIEDITSYILDKFKAEAKMIEDEANEKYSSHIKSSESKAKAEFDAILENAHMEAKRKLEMADSSANQIQSKELLKIKNEAVKNVILKAKEKILKMDEKSYEAFLVSLLKRYNENKDGEIILSLADENKELKLLKKEAKALGLDISKEKANISGGFILKYGSIEQNCSVEAVFKEKNEELTDYINSKLFE